MVVKPKKAFIIRIGLPLLSLGQWFANCLSSHLSHNWHICQIDFVLTYPQAKVSHYLYMLVPDKFKVENSKLHMDQATPPPWQQKYKMKLLQNLYGLKDAGSTWFNHLQKGLLGRGSKQSQVDPCLFYKKDLILIMYVDNCILMLISPHSQLLDEWVINMKKRLHLMKATSTLIWVLKCHPSYWDLNQA